MKLNKNILSLVSVMLIALSGPAFIVLSSNGISGHTGSPGESTCAACHGGGSSAATDVSISATPSFSNNEFVPGTTYTLGVTVSAAGFSKFGFDCEILNGLNTNSGLMQVAGSGVKFLNSGSRKNAVHTTAKAGSGNATFNFQWVAPSVDTLATVYVCGNAVNGNNSTSGDLPLLMSPLQLKAAAPPPDTNQYVSVNEQTMTQVSFYISPNPARDLVSVSYNLSDRQELAIQLCELSGKLIRQIELGDQAQGNYNKTISLDGLSGGVYFIKLLDKQHIKKQELLIIQ
ncbi:MAG TPA: T9SS type A sorting domain-containing protein [Bacteroidia bacterium]|nr:T9SS type A sorting domain-containing protein [Bacteroidia bacterium]